MLKFLQLIRYPNLLIIIATQYLFKIFLIAHFLPNTLSPILFFCLVLATVCIAAGGYIINDIHDVKADLINKPTRVFITTYFSKKEAYNSYIGITVLGIILGSFVAISIGKPLYILLFVAIALLLFAYAKKLKGIPILGTIVVSILVASSLLILGFLDVYSAEKGFARGFTFFFIFYYSFFAFFMNFIREIVKDIEDMNGDYAQKIKTLPIVLGRSRTGKIIALIAGMFMIYTFYKMHSFVEGKTVIIAYFLLTFILPMLFFIFKTWYAQTNREYRFLSLFLKIIMCFGLLSIVVFHYFDPIFS